MGYWRVRGAEAGNFYPPPDLLLNQPYFEEPPGLAAPSEPPKAEPPKAAEPRQKGPRGAPCYRNCRRPSKPLRPFKTT